MRLLPVLLMMACLPDGDPLVLGADVPLTNWGGGWSSTFDQGAVSCSIDDCCRSAAVQVFDSPDYLQDRLDELFGQVQAPEGLDLYGLLGLLVTNDACDGPGWSLEPTGAQVGAGTLDLRVDLVEPSGTDSVRFRSWSLSTVEQADYGRVQPTLTVR